MALVNAVGGAYSAASVKNNNGTIVKGGDVASDGPVTSVLGINELADDKGESFGSKVVANDGTGVNTTDRAGVKKAVSGGTLAYSASATEWVMRGGNVSTTLGGVANTQLVGGARDYSGSLNDEATEVARTKIADIKVGSYATQGFDMLAKPSTNINPNRSGSGTDGKGVGAGVPQTFVNPADGTAAVASEIAPTRAVPGELTYFFGELAAPTTDDYKASNVYES
jgi:hypothetical protein